MKNPSLPASLPAYLVLVAVTAACARHSGSIPGAGPGVTPVFETRVEIPTGTAVHSDYRIADFNGDGLLDMAVISLTGEIAVRIGNGTTFTDGANQQIDGLPIWMTGGDLDNDGDEDLVVVRSFANSTDVLLNDGTGVFTQSASLPIGTDALAVTLGDFDDDDVLDVAVSRPDAPEIYIGFGQGDGTFPSSQSIGLPGPGVAFNLAAGDATGDGVTDLIVADPSASRVLILPGVQSSGYGLAEEFWQLDVPGAPAAVAFGDLSGDQQDDLVVSAFTANKYVVITAIFGEDGTKGGGPTAVIYNYDSFDIPVPARPSLATVADVTGDGLPDLCACLAFTATMCIAPQVPGGGVGPQILLDASGLPLRPFVGDFDLNGRADLFALSGGGDRVNLWLATDTGRLAGARNFISGLATAAWLEGGDFDRDGDAEVVTGSFNDSRLAFLGRGDLGLTPELLFDVGVGVNQVESGDLDGDGRLDLVVGTLGGIKCLRNTSTPGSYSFEVIPVSATIGSGDFPFGIAIGDLDRDGDMDIAFCDYLGGGVHVVPGTAQPFVFGAESVITVGGGPVDLVAADFTGDGRLDLATSRATLSDILVLRNDGSTFSELVSIGVGQFPNYLVTADFNRDGRNDLVVSNAVSGSVSVLFGEANGFSGQEYPAGALPTALLARDLSGDGVPDILVASLQSGDFRVMVGDGNGSFPTLPTFPGTFGASDAVLEDIDADGRTDLLISSLVTNRVSLVVNITPLVAN